MTLAQTSFRSIVRSGVAALAALGGVLCGGAAFALQPDEILKDKALEARARAISAELRCLVCQNQSIDDSDAPLAKDLRVLVRERLVAGDNDEAVRAYIVQRYGDFVLLKPPVNSHTLFLWLAPLMVLAAAGVIVARTVRAPAAKEGAAEPLSSREEEELAAILKTPSGKDPA